MRVPSCKAHPRSRTGRANSPLRGDASRAGLYTIWLGAALSSPWSGAQLAAQAADEDWGSEASDAAGFGDTEAEAEPGWGDGNDSAGFATADESTLGSASESDTNDVEPVFAPPSPLTLSGFVRTREALWLERLDEHPLAKARQSLDLELRYKERAGEVLVRALAAIHFEYDLAYLIDRDRFDDETLDVYEWQVIGGETFVAVSYDALELTVGRQIVSWGQGELLSPLDVVNPRDMREPGLAELDDIRLAVLASRLGVFVDRHRIEVMAIHENDFGLLPSPGSDFSPLRALFTESGDGPMAIGPRDLRQLHVPGDRFDPKATRILGRYSYQGAGIDLALYAASVLDRQGVPTLPSPADLERDPTPLRIYHPRYLLLGHAGAWPEGDFLLRWELGTEVDRPLAAVDRSVPVFDLEAIRRTELLAMVGVTYSGISDGTLGIEISQAYVLDNPNRDEDSKLRLLAEVEQPVFGLRYTHDFLRETLQLTVVAMVFGVTEYRGLLGRAELQYELRDALKIGLGYVTYQPHGGIGPITGFDRNDRLFATLRWDFVAL